MTRLAAIQTPEEGATYWVARRRLGLMSAADEAAFAAWRAEPENAEALAEVEEVVDEVGAVAAFSEVRAMREAALTAAPPKRPAWRAYGAIAASLVAVAGLWAVTLPQAPIPDAPIAAM